MIGDNDISYCKTCITFCYRKSNFLEKKTLNLWKWISRRIWLHNQSSMASFVGRRCNLVIFIESVNKTAKTATTTLNWMFPKLECAICGGQQIWKKVQIIQFLPCVRSSDSELQLESRHKSCRELNFCIKIKLLFVL